MDWARGAAGVCLAAGSLAGAGCLSAASSLQSLGVGGVSGPPRADARSETSRARAAGVLRDELDADELVSAMVSDDVVVRFAAQRRLRSLAAGVEYDYRWARPRLERAADEATRVLLGGGTGEGREPK